MSEEETPESSPEITDTIYSEDGVVLETFVEEIEKAIESDDRDAVREALVDLHESEVGDILAAVEEESRGKLVELAGEDFDFAALTEVDEAIRLNIIDNLPNEQVAKAVRELDSDDAVYILEDLESDEREDILSQIPFQERIRLRRSLDYPENTAGRRMQTEFIAVPPFWNVGQALDYLRSDENLPERFTEIIHR